MSIYIPLVILATLIGGSCLLFKGRDRFERMIDTRLILAGMTALMALVFAVLLRLLQLTLWQ